MTVYFDTHVVVRIFQGERDKLGSKARHALGNYDLFVSPAAVLEMELLHEIGRLRVPAAKMLALLETEIGLRVCDLPFRDIVNHALKESWTRDPFDRLIVANAKAAGAPLVTKDERILKHYPLAIW